MTRKLVGRLAAGALAVGCVGVATGCYWRAARPPAADTQPTATQPPAGGNGLFAAWPAGKPQLAIVLSGQTYGYLSPCGCSSPQRGGLERRANLMDQLRGKGWEVVGLDLGDIAATKGVHPQDRLKYRTAMKALAGMGYAAVGVGEDDFKAGLFDLLADYPLNNPGRPPTVLSAGIVGTPPPGGQEVPRDKLFPGGAGNPPLVEDVTVVARPGAPAVGVVAVVGKDAAEKVSKLDPQFKFLNNVAVLPAALQKLAAHPAKPALRVLLYYGPLEQAKAAAETFPQFQLVICRSDDPEPPNFPTPANGGKTQIVQVGEKGLQVGVVGVFPAAGGGFDLRYERVVLSEEYLTPPGAAAEKASKVLALLQEYSDEVRRIDSLKLFRAKTRPHPAQVKAASANLGDLSFVGSDACKACHPAEWQQHQQTKHSHAYAALAEVAKRPSGRQFDGECIVCHTVGFENPTGYDNEAATPHLKNVGCESCHGPGSGHGAKPADPQLLALLSPWKTEKGDKLPDLTEVKRLAELTPLQRGQVAMPPAQKRVEIQVSNLCQKCHDPDNDPHFDLWKYLPKIWHSKK